MDKEFYLSNNDIKKITSKLKNIDDKFELSVLEYLAREKTGNLHILSDFYQFCCDVLEINSFTDYNSSKRKVQYRLKKLVDKNLITAQRIGSGFMGKCNFGVCSINIYSLID